MDFQIMTYDKQMCSKLLTSTHNGGHEENKKDQIYILL